MVALRVSRLFLRCGLRLSPARFRHAYGDEMEEAFQLRCNDALRLGGVSALAGLVLKTTVDLVVLAFAARRDRRQRVLAARAQSHRTPGRVPPEGRPSRRIDLPQETLIVESILQDIRYGTRVLRANPGFTLAAVITLALGIGLNTAVFSIVNGLVLRPMPGIANADRLVAMFTDGGVSSYVEYKDFRDRLQTMSGLAVYKPRLMDVAAGDATERVPGMMVSANYFDVLGVRPATGRFFRADEDVTPGAHPLAVLSHGFWLRRFGGDPGVVGESLIVNGLPFEILGVTPRSFRGTQITDAPDLYAPMAMQPVFMPSSGNLLDRRGWGGTLVVGRLADGVTLERARADFAAVGEWLDETYPTQAGKEYTVVPFYQATVMPGMRAPILTISRLLLAIMWLVLVVACVNVAGLVRLKAAVRGREIAIRQAIGAGRGRMVRQLVIEALLLAILGGAGGLAMAAAASRFTGVLPLPFEVDTSIDVRVLLYALAATLVTGLVFGVAPAVAASRRDLLPRLGREGARTRAGRLGGGLVVAQVSLSVVLLVMAGLLGRSLNNLQAVDLGYDPTETLVLTLDPSLQGYERDEIEAYYRQVDEQLERLPGVRAVSAINSLPGPDSEDTTTYSIDGYTAAEGERLVMLQTIVDYDYFPTVGIPMIEGRGFGVGDDRVSSPVVILNQTAANRVRELTNRPAVGARISVQGPEGPWIEVIGVVADSVTGGVRAAARPNMYGTQRQFLSARMAIVVRAETDASALTASVLDTLRRVDPNVPAFEIKTFEQHLGETLATDRFTAGLVALSAGLALVLTLVGLYGVLSQTVQAKVREIGIRMALGARAFDVRRLVVRRTALLVCIGLGIGLLAALAASTALTSLLFGVSTSDPVTLIAVIGALLAAGTVAAWVPARRATTVDPMVTLRSD